MGSWLAEGEHLSVAAVGELCVARMFGTAEGQRFQLGRVLKTSAAGIITHLSLSGEMQEAKPEHAKRTLKAEKVYSVAGEAGKRANARAVFPAGWDTLTQAKRQVLDEWGRA